MKISRVFLARGSTHAAVAADLYHEITGAHVQQWQDTWIPAFDSYCAHQPPARWPQDKRWNWGSHVANYANLYDMFALVCDGDLQGLMISGVSLRPSDRMPMVYIELVSTAPWNRAEIENPPRFRGVGKSMIKAAIKLSVAEEYKGRIALHSLSGAEDFYRKCGMTDLGMDEEKEMVYFEMTEAQAEAFLRANP